MNNEIDVNDVSIRLVDKSGNRVGKMNKLLAHQLGELHEAFSVLIFNHNNELLLQKRAAEKYHSGGLWTNTCCSNPNDNDNRDLLEIAKERLQFEMGFVCDLVKVDILYYKSEIGCGMIEHEYDHIILGRYNGVVTPNASEVEDYKWLSLSEIISELQAKPESYTSWFQLITEMESIKNKLYLKYI